MSSKNSILFTVIIIALYNAQAMGSGVEKRFREFRNSNDQSDLTIMRKQLNPNAKAFFPALQVHAIAATQQIPSTIRARPYFITSSQLPSPCVLPPARRDKEQKPCYFTFDSTSFERFDNSQTVRGEDCVPRGRLSRLTSDSYAYLIWLDRHNMSESTIQNVGNSKPIAVNTQDNQNKNQSQQKAGKATIWKWVPKISQKKN